MIVDLEQVCIKVREKALEKPDGITKGSCYIPMLMSDGCLIGQSIIDIYGKSYIPLLKKSRFLRFKYLCDANFSECFIKNNQKYIDWLCAFQEAEDKKLKYSLCVSSADEMHPIE
jgi:hypothetical protein